MKKANTRRLGVLTWHTTLVGLFALALAACGCSGRFGSTVDTRSTGVAGAEAQRLHDAVANGDAVTVRELLDNGSDINMRYKGGESLLILAVTSNHPEMVRYLVSRGANVNQGDSLGNTATCLAAAYGRVDVMRFLLEHGAGLNGLGSQQPPIVGAGDAKGMEALVYLVKKGADVNCHGPLNRTPLMCCAHGGKLEGVKLLLAHGARKDVKDDSGRTALDYAMLRRRGDIVSLLKR